MIKDAGLRWQPLAQVEKIGDGGMEKGIKMYNEQGGRVKMEGPTQFDSLCLPKVQMRHKNDIQ